MRSILRSARESYSALVSSRSGDPQRTPDVSNAEFMESRVLLAALNPASYYNLFIFDSMNQSNADVEGRLAVGGPLTLSNCGVASAVQGADRGRGADFALVSGTCLTFTNGQINGDLYFNDDAVSLSSVRVTGSTFANRTPIDFATAKASLTRYSEFLSTLAATGPAAVSDLGSTLTLNGDPARRLNVFNLTSGRLAATRDGRLNIANVAPTATVLINVVGTDVALARIRFEYNGVAGRQDCASRILYNLPDATSVTIESASPLGSMLAPRAAVGLPVGGGHIDGTLIADSLSGYLTAHEYLFEGELPPMGDDAAERGDAASRSAGVRPTAVGGPVTVMTTLANLGSGLTQNVALAACRRA